MSLDVWLTMPGARVERAQSSIFVREGGSTREITREEWDARFPGCEPVTVTQETSEQVYEANITHNLGKMADAAGIYQACWRPEEIGVTKAGQLVPLLKAGLEKLRADPEHYSQFNAPNGWGLYEHFVPWVERYLAACEAYPDAEISVSR